MISRLGVLSASWFTMDNENTSLPFPSLRFTVGIAVISFLAVLSHR